jgi:hypothetical protein
MCGTCSCNVCTPNLHSQPVGCLPPPPPLPPTPCSEGILWHLLTTPVKISSSLLTKYKESVGDLYCKDDNKTGPTRGVGELGELELANGTFFALPPANKGKLPSSWRSLTVCLLQHAPLNFWCLRGPRPHTACLPGNSMQALLLQRFLLLLLFLAP